MAVGRRITDFSDFSHVHAFILAASGIPAGLHRRLFEKLSSDAFDGGDFFTIEPCEDGKQRRLVLTSGGSSGMAAESDVFLVDHAWSFRLPDAYKQLFEVPGLAERMAALMCVDLDRMPDEPSMEDQAKATEKKESVDEILRREWIRVDGIGADSAAWLELEELDLDDEMLLSLDISSNFPNLIALNLWGNKLCHAGKVVEEIIKCQGLKALWLNENPILNSAADGLAKAIIDGLPELEIYNSCFTSRAGEWALGFCGGLIGAEKPGDFSKCPSSLDSISAIDLSGRSIHKMPMAFSRIQMPSLSYVNIRDNPLDHMSSEDLLKFLDSFPCLEELEVDIPGPLGDSAVKIVESLPNISKLNGIASSSVIKCKRRVIDSVLQPRFPQWALNESFADRVIGAMWLYVMTYRLADEEKIDETPIWYVMDELGSALRHSDDANFRVAPFLFMPEGNLASAVSYSVLWPTRHVSEGEECTRDFLFGIGEEKQRSTRLTAWFQTPETYFIQELNKFQQQLQSNVISPCVEDKPLMSSIRTSDRWPLLVFTDLPQVEMFLKRTEFALATNPKDADIIWTSLQVDSDMKEALGLTDQQYTNQFPFEACLVMKHHLAETIHKAQGSPEWLQPTYNLENQLSQLIGDYIVRKQNGLDNLWIIKPWNMARTIDTTVTRDLSAIIRLMETGPKICQKYIECPALFQGKKFDLRYIVLARSMCPLEIFISDVFWVRLANNQYTVEKSSLFEYETHFTVMNYIGKMNHIHTPQFVREFEKEHQVKWSDIHARIRAMIRSVFESAVAVHPEMQNPFSRAIYGVDVMLDQMFMPKILEVTYCPDCTRACTYDTEAITGDGSIIKASDFYNDVFGCLFLGESQHVSPL